MQGDGVWMTPVTYFYPCDDCLMNALCPNCSRAIPADEANRAAEDTEHWTCGACGWKLDMDRFRSIGDEP
jgi:ribosomal protein S27AE